jgi:hypothetical protein
MCLVIVDYNKICYHQISTSRKPHQCGAYNGANGLDNGDRSLPSELEFGVDKDNNGNTIRGKKGEKAKGRKGSQRVSAKRRDLVKGATSYARPPRPLFSGGVSPCEHEFLW